VRLESNSAPKQFLKGLIDGSLVSSAELIESVVKDPSKIITMLK